MTVVNDGNYGNFLKAYGSLVRVVLFADKGYAKLRLNFRTLAVQMPHIAFAEVAPLQSEKIQKRYNTSIEAKPSLIIVKEEGKCRCRLHPR